MRKKEIEKMEAEVLDDYLKDQPLVMKELKDLYNKVGTFITEIGDYAVSGYIGNALISEKITNSVDRINIALDELYRMISKIAEL